MQRHAFPDYVHGGDVQELMCSSNSSELPDDFGKFGGVNMGGSGSGRWQNGKLTTHEVLALDVRRLQRRDMLAPGLNFDWSWTTNGNTVAAIAIRMEVDRLIFSYSQRSRDGERKPMAYPVDLDWTPCTYGGRRAWFLCPANGCGRRVAKLYFVGAGICACRHCYQLAYVCQREAADFRAMRRADAIRAVLGWRAGILNGHGGKPWGMHLTRFESLVARHDAFIDVALAEQSQWIARLEKRTARRWTAFVGPHSLDRAKPAASSIATIRADQYK